MTDHMATDDIEARARRQVDARLAFWVHLAIYVCVVALLVGINLTFTPEQLWFVWTVVGWTVGLFFHGLLYSLFSAGGKVKKRMVQKEIARQQEAIPHVPEVPRHEP